MQRFIAELSSPIDKGDFERTWENDSAVNPDFHVDFVFAGRTVSITIEAGLLDRWQSHDFRRIFSGVIRRLDQNCNVRWL